MEDSCFICSKSPSGKLRNIHSPGGPIGKLIKECFNIDIENFKENIQGTKICVSCKTKISQANQLKNQILGFLESPKSNSNKVPVHGTSLPSVRRSLQFDDHSYNRATTVRQEALSVTQNSFQATQSLQAAVTLQTDERVQLISYLQDTRKNEEEIAKKIMESSIFSAIKTILFSICISY